MHIIRNLLNNITISRMLILFNWQFNILKFKLLILILIEINIIFPAYLSMMFYWIDLYILYDILSF